MVDKAFELDSERWAQAQRSDEFTAPSVVAILVAPICGVLHRHAFRELPPALPIIVHHQPCANRLYPILQNAVPDREKQFPITLADLDAAAPTRTPPE